MFGKTSTQYLEAAYSAAEARRRAGHDAAAFDDLLASGATAGPLSFVQERLWLREQLEGSSVMYNRSLASRLQGPLDVEALQHSLSKLVARHAALRTTFHLRDGQPVQVIADSQSVRLSTVDLSQQPQSAREASLERVLAAESRRPFDTTRGPLLRALLVRVADADHALLMTLHRLVCDGESLSVLAHEISESSAAYQQGRVASLRDPRVQYVDFAAWQRDRIAGAELERLLAYWAAQLAGATPLLELPYDRPRPAAASGPAERVQVQLPAALVTSLKDLGEAHDATLSMTLLAGFGALLGRYTHHDDLLVGFPVAGRTRPELDALVGLFANTLALRIDVSGDPCFSDLLGRVRAIVLAAHSHQELPFEKLVEILQPSHSRAFQPLVQVTFGLSNEPPPALQQTNVTSTPIDLRTATSEADLHLALTVTDSEVECRFEYDADLFDRTTVERFSNHYKLLLEGIVADPRRSISQFPLLPASERQQVLVDWNSTAASYPRELRLHQVVEAQVDRTPRATAVVAQAGTMSYQTLDTLANQLAHHLVDLGVGRGDLVALGLDRTADMLVALLAIGKAGAGYVPLDPSHPVERRAFILADSGARLLLTQRDLLTDAPTTSLPVLCLDAPTVRAAVAAQSTTRPEVVATAEDVAYVIYTSGSTGRPKGVRVPHRTVVNLLAGTRQTPGIASDDVVLAITTLAFDIAVYDLWAPLSVGATIALTTHEAAGDGHLLLDLLRRSGATILQATPSTWRLLIEAGWQGGSPLKVISTGEALPRDLAEQLVSRADDVWNMYGPTETTVWSAYWRVPRQPGPILIGRPMANTRLYVLDAAGQPTPVGVSGELYIGGDGVADGYLGLRELTIQRFVPDPFVPDADARMYRTGDVARWRSDGQVEYLGRNDHQVKLRGYRIELGEIEALLREHPLVRDAAVIVREDTPGDQLVVAYIVSFDRGSSALPAGLRAFLRRRLPEPMVPAAFVALPSLPITANGKLDRGALTRPEPMETSADDVYCGPRDDVESRLVSLWQELLGHSRIGINDNFFELGGNSLLAARLVFRIQASFERNLPVATLIKAATIAELASLIKAPEREEIWDPLVELQAGLPGRLPLFFVHGAFGDVLCYTELARAIGPQQPCYVLQAIGLDGRRPPQDCVEDMASTYVQQMRAVQPVGPYCLAGYSLGGTIVYEMARQLKAANEGVALLAVFDHPPVLGRLTRRPPVFTFWVRFIRNVVTNVPHWTRMARQVKRGSWTALFVQRGNLARRALLNLFGGRDPSIEEAVRELEEISGLTYLADWPSYRRRVLEYQFRAVRAYQPRPLEGSLLLFRARRQPLVSPHDPQLGWGDLIRGRIEVINVPGNHQDLLHEPTVHVVAARLRTCLAVLAE